MAKTMGQALAERIRSQIAAGEKVLEAAGAQHGNSVFGKPEDVLSVTGNISDVAHTNHLWLLDAKKAGIGGNGLDGALQRERPETVQDAVTFLAPRDTDSPAQALTHLRLVNEKIASAAEGLSDQDLEKPVNVTFYGEKTLRDLFFTIIEHGSLHIGQAWGILKGHGVGV
jgi:hypothetical protein